MKNLLRAGWLLAAASLALPACQDAQRLPTPTRIVPLIRATVAADADTFDLVRARYPVSMSSQQPMLNRPVCRFTLNRNYSSDGIIIRKVLVYKMLRRGADSATYTFSTRALAREVTSLPATLTIDSQEALTGIYRLGAPTTGTNADSLGQASTAIPLVPPLSTSFNRIFLNDAIVFTFEYEVEINGQTQHVVLDPTHKVSVEYPTPQELEVLDGPPVSAPYSVTVPFR